MSFAGKRVIALIPARGGSKGIPRKNLAPLAGKPLMAHSIDAGLGSAFVDEVVVSSDDAEILEAARRLGAVALKRPAALAADSTPTAPVIEHLLESRPDLDPARTLILLLQATSPLRDAADVDAAFALLGESGDESLISVCVPDESPFKTFVCDAEGFLRGLVDDEAPFRPRQELPTAYQPNGAIYIFGARAFLDEARIPMKRARPFVMDFEKSIDIDEPRDLSRAEAYLASRESA